MWFSNYWGQMPLELSKLSAKKLKAFENNLEFQNIFHNFFNAALNQFEWKRLPDTCDERMLERGYLLSGRALIGDDNGGLLSLVGAPASGLTLYGYPVRAFGWGFNGYNKEFNLYVRGADETPEIARNAGGLTAGMPNAVMGYDNACGYPYVNYLITECHRLANLKMAIDVLTENLKQPLIVSCDDTSINTVKEAFKNRADNIPAIVGTGKLPIDSFKVWDTKANPETLAAFKALYEWYEANLRELFGINSNEQTDKKERLLVDEVNANDQMTIDSVDKRLVWRQKFAEDCNKVFGTNISVSLRNPPKQAQADMNETEGDDDDVDMQEL